MKILIVEDDAGIAELLKDTLEEGGHETTCAQTAAEALTWLDDHSPDLLMLDYRLPDMDGKEFIEALQQKEQLLPAFLVATGQGDEWIAVNMMKLGARDYIVKDTNFLKMVPEVIRRVEQEIENEKKLSQAEEDLRQSEEKFRSITEQMTDMVFITDTQGTVLYVSPATERIFGYTSDEMQGNPFTKFLSDTYIPAAMHVFTETLSTGKPCRNLHLEMKRKDSSIFWGELDGTLYRNDGIVGTIGLIRDISARRQAEQALRESEERFRGVFETSPTGIAIVDTVTQRFIEANNSFLQILGYSLEELQHLTVMDVTYPEDWEREAEAVRAYLNGNLSAYLVEKRYIRKDGEIRWIRTTGDVLSIDPDEPPLAIANVEDITERKQAEETLRESEERFRQVYEHMTVGVARVSLDFRITSANEAYCRMLGYREEELIGKHLRDITHQEILEENLRKQSQLARGEIDHYRMEKQFVHKSGRVITGILDANLVRDADGKPYYFLGSVLDITERKRAEEALRESEEKYHALFEHLPIPVFTKNRAGEYTSCNAENQKYWAVNPIGRTDAELLDHETTAALRKADLQVMETGNTLTLEEHLINTPLGERQVLSRKVPLRDGKGQIVGILGASLDITDRKEAEENIKAALKEKEVLLRELYHRTKNNMQVISSMLALQSYSIENEEVRHIFKDIDLRIRSMALVHHKLYESHNLSSINLKEYIYDLIALLVSSYTASERITFDIDAEDVLVLIDTAMPCGLLLNELISNVLKHAFPGEREGRISIVLRRVDHNHLELIVADNGIGVPDNFDFRHAQTLGLQNVFALAERQLAGEITFIVNNGLTCRTKFRDDLYQERV